MRRAPSQENPRAPAQQPFDNFSVFLVVIGLVSLGSCMAGIFTDVYTYNTAYGKVQHSLWTIKTCPAVSTTCHNDNLPNGCGRAETQQRTLQAFAILSTVASLLVLLTAFLEIVIQRPAGTISSGFLFLAFIFILVEWAVQAGVYHASWCEGPSLSALGYRLSLSFAFFLCTWIIQFLGLAIFIFARLCARPKGYSTLNQ